MTTNTRTKAPETFDTAPSISWQRHARWVGIRRLTAWLLLAWFSVTFGIVFFARELSSISFFGWPLSFYLAAQGAVIFYTVIVGIYAFKMRAYDHVNESDDGDVE